MFVYELKHTILHPTSLKLKFHVLTQSSDCCLMIYFTFNSPIFILVLIYIYICISYLPPAPFGQDMTQGQFFKRSITGLNSEFSFS